ncbi:MAG: hypothetical protein QGG50_08070 [Methanopyri archaeon]|jgi:hypothetical protein|nr:hypothetical protein [Methanopyri archaeon]
MYFGAAFVFVLGWMTGMFFGYIFANRSIGFLRHGWEWAEMAVFGTGMLAYFTIWESASRSDWAVVLTVPVSFGLVCVSRSTMRWLGLTTTSEEINELYSAAAELTRVIIEKGDGIDDEDGVSGDERPKRSADPEKSGPVDEG